MYADTVVSDKLVHKPKFVGLLILLFLAVLLPFDTSNSFVGYLLEPALGPPAESGYFGRVATAFLLSLLIVLNIVVIALLPPRFQLPIIWIELAALFLSTFAAFNLSLEFIQGKFWFIITQGLFTTLYISVISIALAFVFAITGAVAKLSSNSFAYGIATFYTSVFRGIPLLVQLFIIYLGLPQLGYVIDAVPAGIIALSLCYGAYMTEIFRAGIQSIPKGQWEASRSIGFSFAKTMRRIILPQAVPLIIPPTGNQFIAMLKDSSLVSVIGVWELMFLARTLGTRDFKHMEMLITVAMIYWVMTMILESLQARIENHYRRRS
ncbi:amino acid ABC transporter permease [Rhodovibrionaceae bacterium A322]